MSEDQMIDPGRPGDDGDVALDAALAAADDDMLAAISNGLDLDTGLARILKDLGGSSAAGPGTGAPGHPEEDRRRPGAVISRNPFLPVRTWGTGTAAIDVAGLILSVNGSDEAAGDQYLRARQAAGIAARSARTAELSAATAERAAIAHQAIQAERPHRAAPLPRQATLALGTMALDGVACYLAGRALHGSQGTTRACLYTAATAGFLSLSYRALRAAETPPAWRARRQARQARQAAQAAHATADHDAAGRDRLIDAYLGHVRRLALTACPAERQPAVESVIRKHLLGEYPLGEEQAWRPSRTLTILHRLRAGSRSAWSRWRASADTRAYLAADRTDM